MNKLLYIKKVFVSEGKLIMMLLLMASSRFLSAQTGVVGSLGGEVAVSPMGAATYSIPIEVVPGTNGMQPNLSVTYNSVSGRGLLGMGWTLSGLSSISRTPRNNFFDHDIGTINFDGNDRFALDGERLFKLSGGNYVVNNAVYGTEVENFTRVTLKGDPATPDSVYFVAVDDQGRDIEYGHSTQSKLKLPQGGILYWMVNKITDANGNYMTFLYDREAYSGEIVPWRIYYTGNESASLNTYALVEFEYTTDPNYNKTYIGGNTIYTTKLLNKIVVYYGSTIVRQYEFKYDIDCRGTRLSAVILQNATGNELTRTTIAYGSDQQQTGFNPINGISQYGRRLFDYNGDNIMDLLLTNYSNGLCQWSVKDGVGDGTFTSANLEGSLWYAYPMFTLDYQGDGKDEFGYVYHNPNSDDYVIKIMEYRNNSFVETHSWTRQSGQFLMGDFSGEGGTQFVFIANPSGHYREVTYSYNNNSSFSIPENSLLSVTDMNGNGKAEIQVVNGNSFCLYEYNKQQERFEIIYQSPSLSHNPTQNYHADLNGDGMMDYIYYTYSTGEGGHWYLKISKGNGYKDPAELPFNTQHTNATPSFPLVISDFNGDGKDDIIQPTRINSDPLTLNVYYTRNYQADGWHYDTLQLHHSGITDCYPSDYQAANVYNEGKNDLFYIGHSGQNPIIVHLPEKREHDLVTSVTNGFGKTTYVVYKFYHSPMMNYLGPDGKHVHHPLVSMVRQPDGIGGIHKTTYNYNEAVFDYGRRQVLGFKILHTYCDGINNLIKFLYFDTKHYLSPDQSLTFNLTRNQEETGGYVTDTAYWNALRDLYYHFETSYSPAFLTFTDGRFVPYSSSTSYVNRLENSAKTVACWLNGQGRVYKTTTTYKKSASGNRLLPWISEDSTCYAYTTVSLSNGNAVVKPESVEIWNIRNGFSQRPFRYTGFAYDTKGRVIMDSVCDSKGQVGKTAYVYNNLGLPVTETYTPYGMAPVTKTFTYDTKGRFITQETDALNHTRFATYDKYTGWMTSETDVNNLTTSYQYDALGRPTRITRPDQTVSNMGYYWENSSVFPDAVYYTRETEAGTPETRTYYDILGRPIHTYCAGQGYHDAVYDHKGRMVQKTYIPYDDPHTATSSKTWHTFGYDSYDRVVQETNPYTDLSYTYYEATVPSDYFVTVIDNIRNTRQTKTYDAIGRLISAQDGGGSISYGYAYETVSGQIRDKMTITVGNAVTTVVSDIRGNRLSIQDPDAGTVTSTYNVLNQLTSRTDANGNQTYYSYDLIGRPTRVTYEKNSDDEVVIYTYDNASGKGIGKLASVQHDGVTECTYTYDTLGRLYNRQVSDAYDSYDHIYEYDTLGRLEYLTYPDGFQIKHTYNEYGELQAIRNADDNSRIYSIETRNAFRQPLICLLGNGTGTEYSYNGYGMLTGIKNGNYTEQEIIVHGGVPGEMPIIHYIIGSQYRNLTYTYNNRGFIVSRSEANTLQSESYSYDALDRLVSYTVNGVNTSTFAYSNSGNITANSNVGEYTYSVTKPHAVTMVDHVANGVISGSQCDVTYNLRNRPSAISENGYNITFDYDASGMRRHTRINNNNALVKEKTRVSDLYEMDEDLANGRRLDYIYAEGRIVAVHVNEGVTESLYYPLTDHLGSWEKVLDENKTTVQQTHFSPWGNRMSYTSWDTPQTQTLFTFDRGFTGHEHYDNLKIINANARLYDPVIGRFFSPDPFVQAPDFTQNYNRYSYCMNNPVMYSDPDGEFFVLDAGLLGFIYGFFGNSENRFSNGWNKAKQLAANDVKIMAGMFTPDFDKGFFGRNWDVLSRLTWEFPQTKVGATFAFFSNLCGQVDNVEYYGGVTVSRGNNFGKGGAVTLGNYINGSKSLHARPDNSLFQHEYGHYLQSQAVGPFYLSRYGIPSGLNCSGKKVSSHGYHPVEQDANIRAFKYFNKKIDGFSEWDFIIHPIVGYESALPMTDEGNQAALRNGRLQPAWYDYLLSLSPVAGGLTNPMVGGVFKIMKDGLLNWWILEDYEEY